MTHDFTMLNRFVIELHKQHKNIIKVGFSFYAFIKDTQEHYES